jgi:hypothetical protein
MVVDFEHHYIPAELGRRFGLDPPKKEAVKTRNATVHAQLFDLGAQIQDMDRVGIDVAVQSCILGWDTTLENCQLINECSARAQKDYPGRFVAWRMFRHWRVRRRSKNWSAPWSSVA